MPAVSSVSCSLKPPAAAAAPFKEATSARPQPTPATTTRGHWSSSLRRACVAAAACAVVGMAGSGPSVSLARDDAVASRANGGGVVVGMMDARAGPPPRWSDRRQCPPWRANSLENVVPENLPRPSAQRRFNDATVAGTGGGAASPSPDAVAPFLARRASSGMGCFSL